MAEAVDPDAATLDSMRAVVHVFTYRDGLLAKLAHDLRLRVDAFEIVVEGGAVQAWFDANSLAVDGVAHGERVETGSPSAEDKRQIEQTLRREVLRTELFPRIELSGTLQLDGAGGSVKAALRLHGHEQTLLIPLSRTASGLCADITFAPSDFGIKPYKALGGAIRTADRLRVRVGTELANLAALAADRCIFRPND